MVAVNNVTSTTSKLGTTETTISTTAATSSPANASLLFLCPSPSPIDNGSVKKHENFLFYNCDNGYTLQGVSEQTCLPNGTWSDYSPKCVCE